MCQPFTFCCSFHLVVQTTDFNVVNAFPDVNAINTELMVAT